MTKKLFLAALTAMVMLATGALAADTKPKSVIHVITVKWNADAKPAQIEQAIKAADSSCRT